jgi:hypothetical protein
MLKHILNFGMGVESTAILLRWIFEPASRPFGSWDELIILTAQTGDEMPETKDLVEQYLLPLINRLGLRWVQVAKASKSKRDGYTVLGDAGECHIEGRYKLSANLMDSGTAIRLGRPHTCAMRWKGEVLDQWILDHTPECTQYFGYNADEKKRADKADGYVIRGSNYVYPLIEWGWSRDDCLEYIYRLLGVMWLKSACLFCPFTTRQYAIDKYRRDPVAAGFTMLLELNTLAFNSRQHLFNTGTAYDLIAASGNQEALDNFQQRLAEFDWAIYYVRRIYKQSGKTINADRCIKRVAQGTQAEMVAELKAIGQRVGQRVQFDYCHRLIELARVEGVYPACESFHVVAPCIAEDKVRNRVSFERLWAEVTGQIEQMTIGGL